MEVIIFWLIASIIVGVIASSRGRSGGGWFLLSLLISPLLTIVPVLALPKQMTRRQALQLRACPFCAEVIRREAKVCKHCHHEVAPIVETQAAVPA
jgi:hypothetical protein